MSIITLTTDYGTKDHFVGVIKGKILSQNPQIQIIDISHEIDFFNIAETAYILKTSYKSFPDNTIHIIGVESEQNDFTNHIAIKYQNQFFICANNGILGLFLEQNQPQEAVEFSFEDLPSDFDSFIKAALQIASDNSLSNIGKPLNTIVTYTDLQPQTDINSIKGHIVYIDYFGNCVTNISKDIFENLRQNRNFEISFGTNKIKKIHRFYADFTLREGIQLKDYEGQKLAIFNEAGFLEIALFKSNPKSTGTAQSLLGLEYRDAVTVKFL